MIGPLPIIKCYIIQKVTKANKGILIPGDTYHQGSVNVYMLHYTNKIIKKDNHDKVTV